MADPVTLSAIAIGAGVAGGAVSGLGGIFSSNANASSAQYKAGVAKINQSINLQNAAWARDAGDVKAMESGLQSGQEISNTKVVQAASGLDITKGSAAAVRTSQTTAAQFDENVIRFDAAKTAYGYETKAAGAVAEANLDEAASSNDRTAGTISAVGSFISTAGSVSSKWIQGNTIGIGSGAAAGNSIGNPTVLGSLY